MAKKVMITTDSPADLPKELAERYNVAIFPLHVILGDTSYDDGVNIVPEDIFKYYDEHKKLPKTSATSIDEYMGYFKPYLEQDMEIVHFSLSSGISASHQAAKLAAEDLENVYVVDTKSLCCGMALLIIKACEMRDKGMTAQEIVKETEVLREKIVCKFILDKLEFLHKGGRCSGLAAFGANVLGIKPSIAMNDGVLGVHKKYRGKIEVCQMQYMNDAISEAGDNIDFERIFIGGTVGVPEAQFEAVRKEIKKKYKFKEIITIKAGCVITSHCGKNTFAVMFMQK